MSATEGDDGGQKPSLLHRASSSIHYQTFPTAPPRNAGRQAPRPDAKSNGRPISQESGDTERSHSSHGHNQTPLPKGQLAVLAIIALAEQTALNSISPYLPDMASTFSEVEEEEIGLYVGLIASSFALAQFATNFAWGWASDRVGRKPIVLIGTFLTACCFVAFGLSRTLWQAVLVQALMGLVNGNQGVISTCLGEITDRSNQSRAFTYLPVIYGLGGITGPLVGGLLVQRQNPFKPDEPNPYPYLLPNVFSAAILLVDFVVTAIFMRESLEGAQDLPPIGSRLGSLFTWLWQFTSSHRPTYLRPGSKKSSGTHHNYRHVASDNNDDNDAVFDEDDDTDDEDDSDADDHHTLPQLLPNNAEHISSKHVLTRDTTLLLITYLIFQLGNIGYNSLYPIFSEARPPTGRGLLPQEIGTSLAFAGLVTIVFQIGIFGRVREKIGNRTTYRIGLAGFVVAFLLMPWIGYKDGADGRSGTATTAGEIWLWVELGGILTVKTVASVGGLTSALLLITNSAPSHQVLGTLNGLAQTLSAAGRAVGPFVSGALFSSATRVQPKGEALAFGIFGGISFLGFLLSFGIRGADLEDDGWDEEHANEHDEEEGGAESSNDEEEEEERSAGHRRS